MSVAHRPRQHRSLAAICLAAGLRGSQEHEWRVFGSAGPPEGAALVPGVVGHCTDFIEDPDLVAERLVRHARLAGRESGVAPEAQSAQYPGMGSPPYSLRR